jgi:hypothetical protein
MKVAELKKGMLLKFTQPRYYKFLQDRSSQWLDCGKMDMTQTMRGGVKIGQPLIVYLGQEGCSGSLYGHYCKVRKVSIEGRIAWMWPENWKYVEPVV